MRHSIILLPVLLLLLQLHGTLLLVLALPPGLDDLGHGGGACHLCALLRGRQTILQNVRSAQTAHLVKGDGASLTRASQLLLRPGPG